MSQLFCCKCVFFTKSCGKDSFVILVPLKLASSGHCGLSCAKKKKQYICKISAFVFHKTDNSIEVCNNTEVIEFLFCFKLFCERGSLELTHYEHYIVQTQTESSVHNAAP